MLRLFFQHKHKTHTHSIAFQRPGQIRTASLHSRSQHLLQYRVSLYPQDASYWPLLTLNKSDGKYTTVSYIVTKTNKLSRQRFTELSISAHPSINTIFYTSSRCCPANPSRRNSAICQREAIPSHPRSTCCTQKLGEHLRHTWTRRSRHEHATRGPSGRFLTVNEMAATKRDSIPPEIIQKRCPPGQKMEGETRTRYEATKRTQWTLSYRQ
jgi:hypothetical protein